MMQVSTAFILTMVTLILLPSPLSAEGYTGEIVRKLYQSDTFATPGCFMSYYCLERNGVLPTSGDRCSCRCKTPYTTFHQGLGTCIRKLINCTSLQLGSIAREVPPIYLPTRGNKILPDLPLYHDKGNNTIVLFDALLTCFVKKTLQLNDSNTWVTNGYSPGFQVTPIEGQLFLQWRGQYEQRDELRGNILQLTIECSGVDAAPHDYCLAVKVDGILGSAVDEGSNSPDDGGETPPTPPPSTTTKPRDTSTTQTGLLDPVYQLIITVVVISAVLIIVIMLAICIVCYCRYQDREDKKRRIMRYKEVQNSWETTSQRSYNLYNSPSAPNSRRGSLRSLKSNLSTKSGVSRKKRVSFHDVLIVHEDSGDDKQNHSDHDHEEQINIEKSTVENYKQEKYKDPDKYSKRMKRMLSTSENKWSTKKKSRTGSSTDDDDSSRHESSMSENEDSCSLVINTVDDDDPPTGNDNSALVINDENEEKESIKDKIDMESDNTSESSKTLNGVIADDEEDEGIVDNPNEENTTDDNEVTETAIDPVQLISIHRLHSNTDNTTIQVNENPSSVSSQKAVEPSNVAVSVTRETSFSRGDENRVSVKDLVKQLDDSGKPFSKGRDKSKSVFW